MNRNLVYRFLTKPFEAEEIIQTINDALGYSGKSKESVSGTTEENLQDKIFRNFDEKKMIPEISSDMKDYSWLTDITDQLFTERDRDVLVRKILYITRKITDTDSGSIFILGADEYGNDSFKKYLFTFLYQ